MTDYDIIITGISWHGIYLHVQFGGNCPEDFTLALATEMDRFVVPVESVDPVSKELVLNITNLGHQKMLENGVWYFKYRNEAFDAQWDAYERACDAAADAGEDDPLPPLEWLHIPITFEVGYALKDLDKVYRYAGTSYAYIFSFAAMSKVVQEQADEEPEEDTDGEPATEDLLTCAITCTFMVKTNRPEKRYFHIESPHFAARAKKRLIYFLECIINCIYQVVSHVTPKDGTRVLLMSETRAPITGNLKALDDRIRERGLDQDTFRMSYWFRQTLAVRRMRILFIWLRLAVLTAQQDYIFVDDYCPFFNCVKVHPRTKLIQVWHAGVGFKSVGYARFGSRGTPKPFHCCHRQYDYAIVGGESLRDVYAEVFGIDREQCLPYGLMRLDNYLDPDRIAAFRENYYRDYPQCEGKKLILFAPTFRGASQRTSYYPYEMLDWKRIYDMCGDEYLFLIKQHPFIRQPVEIDPDYADRIMDFSDFPDINALFYVTDMLITDYSSNIYEFSLHKKPILFFVFDKEEYELTRGVHRTIDEFAPGKICETFDELLRAIKEKDFDIEKTYRFVRENFSEEEGLASDRVIDNILLSGDREPSFRPGFRI